MKFGLFYQLPCAPEQDEVTRYHETIEQVVYADELGFDTAWLAELHFFQSFSVMPAPLILATAIAQRTTHSHSLGHGGHTVAVASPVAGG